MVRKTKTLIGAVLALVLGLAFVSAPQIARAATSTVGGSTLKGNGVNSQVVIPSQYGTMTCFSVALSTINPVQVLAADNSRAMLFMINGSTVDIAASGQLQRPPVIYMTSSTVTNLGTSPVSANLYQLNGLPLYPCKQDTIANEKCSPNRLEMTGVSVYKGAVFALAEGDHSGTGGAGSAGADTKGIAQGCYIDP